MKAVIFDLDGTLVDSMGIWEDVDKKFLNSRSLDVPEGLFDSIPQGNSFSGMAQYFKERFSLKESIEEIMQEWTNSVYEFYKSKISLKPGALNTLNFLRDNGIPIAIGTSNSQELAEVVLKSNNIIEYFGHIQTGCAEIKGKPFPDIYLNAAKAIEVLPEYSIVVEDTIAGVRAGKNAGMFTIGIYDQWAKREHEAMKTEADLFLTNHFELLEYFQLIFQKK